MEDSREGRLASWRPVHLQEQDASAEDNEKKNDPGRQCIAPSFASAAAQLTAHRGGLGHHSVARQRAIERCIDQFADGPDMIRHAKLHRRCDPQRLMHPTEIVTRSVEGDSCTMVFQLLAERVGQAGERELTAGLRSKGASFRLIVTGQIGEKETDRLVAKLKLAKEILAEADDPDGDDE